MLAARHLAGAHLRGARASRVAIPAHAGYNYLVSRINKIVLDMERAAGGNRQHRHRKRQRSRQSLMKFPRNTRLLRSPFDVAPFAAVFFLLVIFLLLGALLPVQGLHVQLQPPTANDLPGIDEPGVAVAVDAGGRYYFANQIVGEAQLKSKLAAAVKDSRAPLTLIIHADKSVTYDQLVHLTLLARDAGIQNALLATLPRVTATGSLLP